MYINNFLGNKAVIESIRRDTENSKLGHALILEGTPGSGKKTLARYIALALNCENRQRACTTCPTCRKIISGNSPDVIFVGIPDGKTQINVDTIRFVRSDVYIKPNDNDYKIYIIESADKMTVEAQNAFLKVFEEPPEYAVFILLCESADSLLVTIRSRARILRTERFDASVLAEYLVKVSKSASELKGSDTEAFNLAVARSNGSVGKALENIEPDTAQNNREQYILCSDFLKLIKTRASAFEIMNELQKIEQTREALSDFLSLFETALCDILTYKLSGSFQPRFFLSEDEVSYFSSALTNTFVLEAVKSAENFITSISQNGNIQNIITALAYELTSLRSKY